MAATLISRNSMSLVRRSVIISAIRTKGTMPSGADHATGLEKKELLAKAAGNENPFDMRVIKRNAGTKDTPNQIPSIFDKRLVGCICEEEATCVTWMWLYKGEPRRCECGHWFKLVEAKGL
ncbi:PREDICTED: cytochrome c oxidase subunit 5B, mitochondrial-like [Priapulus caudatus]|uniref:Cytochrome c oxidase subunit 5B, mitochondrial-like n=1 Tax=Priapulus caudatus TaxID=37621 RepID=A0ABM1EPS0_PRICU|nr:PREDICTED: cytochrome c oxidase subunit 5B, mitochondrial-like [Priapulus caudatus]